MTGADSRYTSEQSGRQVLLALALAFVVEYIVATAIAFENGLRIWWRSPRLSVGLVILTAVLFALFLSLFTLVPKTANHQPQTDPQ